MLYVFLQCLTGGLRPNNRYLLCLLLHLILKAISARFHGRSKKSIEVRYTVYYSYPGKGNPNSGVGMLRLIHLTMYVWFTNYDKILSFPLKPFLTSSNHIFASLGSWCKTG